LTASRDLGDCACASGEKPAWDRVGGKARGLRRHWPPVDRRAWHGRSSRGNPNERQARLKSLAARTTAFGDYVRKRVAIEPGTRG